MGEEILGSIVVDNRRMDLLNLVFTSNRIIVAQMISGLSVLTGYLLDAASWYTMGELSEDGGRSPIVVRRLREINELYERSTPEEILRANKENLEIPYGEITRFEMTKPGTLGRGKIKVFTKSRFYSFSVKEKKEEFNYRVNLVRSVLSDRLSVT